ncbi:MAG: hypothetical protein ACYDBQ_12850 [Thermoplasmatota archaeon]
MARAACLAIVALFIPSYEQVPPSVATREFVVLILTAASAAHLVLALPAWRRLAAERGAP